MKYRKVPLRKCVGCQEMKNKKELIRVVRSPHGEIFFDSTGKKSGRGAYICPQEKCLLLAVKGNRLSKALEVKIPEMVLETLKKEIVGTG